MQEGGQMKNIKNFLRLSSSMERTGIKCMTILEHGRVLRPGRMHRNSSISYVEGESKIVRKLWKLLNKIQKERLLILKWKWKITRNILKNSLALLSQKLNRYRRIMGSETLEAKDFRYNKYIFNFICSHPMKLKHLLCPPYLKKSHLLKLYRNKLKHQLKQHLLLVNHLKRHLISRYKRTIQKRISTIGKYFI